MRSCENEFKTLKMSFSSRLRSWENALEMRNSDFSHLMRSCENELKTRKLTISHVWDVVRMSSKNKKVCVLTLEILWEYAQNAKMCVVSRMRLYENELKHVKNAISHVWDRVRMSSKRQKLRFLKREILWEWALTRNKPVFSQCYPPPVVALIVSYSFASLCILRGSERPSL